MSIENQDRAVAYFSKYCSPFASKSDATEELRALLDEAERRGLERADQLEVLLSEARYYIVNNDPLVEKIDAAIRALGVKS